MKEQFGVYNDFPSLGGSFYIGKIWGVPQRRLENWGVVGATMSWHFSKGWLLLQNPTLEHVPFHCFLMKFKSMCGIFPNGAYYHMIMGKILYNSRIQWYEPIKQMFKLLHYANWLMLSSFLDITFYINKPSFLFDEK